MYKFNVRLVFFLLVLLMPSIGFSQDKLPEFVESGSEINIDDDDDFSGLQILDKDAKNVRLFLNGENHTYFSTNKKIEEKIFKYLNKKHKVNNLLIEFSYARGWIITQYINTGDSIFLNMLKSHSGDEYLEMIEDLRDYKVKKNIPIYVHGVDYDRFAVFSFILADYLLPHENIPKELETYVYLMHAQANKFKSDKYSRNYYKEQMRDSAIAMFNRDSSKILNLVDQDKKFLLRKSMLGLSEHKNFSKIEYTALEHIYREQFLFESVRNLMLQNPDNKYFGQLGRCHIGKYLQNANCNWNYYRSIANRMLRDTNNFNANNIRTMAIFYNNNYSEKGFMNQLDELNEYSGNKPYIFKIAKNNQDSLYDYVLLAKASKADIQDGDDAGIFSMSLKYSTLEYINNVSGNNKKLIDLNDLEYMPLPNEFFSLEYEVGIKYGLRVITDFSYIFDKKVTHLSKEYTFRGYQISTNYNYNFLKSKYISIGPYLGIGYSRFSLTEENNNLTSNILPRTNTKFINPGMFLEGGAISNIYLGKHLQLKYQFTYKQDLSKPNWINNKVLTVKKVGFYNTYIAHSIGIGYYIQY